jgi:hypothetical protein
MWRPDGQFVAGQTPNGRGNGAVRLSRLGSSWTLRIYSVTICDMRSAYLYTHRCIFTTVLIVAAQDLHGDYVHDIRRLVVR